MPGDTRFLEGSKSIVKAFLSTVVLVDDQAYLAPSLVEPNPAIVVTPGKQGATRTAEPESTPKEVAGPAIPPVAPTGQVATSALADAASSAVAEPGIEAAQGGTKTEKVDTAKRPSKRDHTLDGKTVIDVFAKIGVVCAVIRPTKEELPGLGDLLMSVGANADVIILDWVLYDSLSGQRTLELIEQLVKSSAAESGRARLIVVYTAEPDLAEIEKGIRRHLKLEESIPTNSLTIISAGTRICVYGKAGSIQAPIGDDRLKAPSDLADVVISEFTEMTKGLLSNVAMKSITAVRAKTFQLLRRFDSTVDAPYATQSALISPERAEEQVTALIVSEIQEILEDETVGSLADHSHIVEWLDDKRLNGLTFPASAKLSSEQYYVGLVQLLKDGVRKEALDKLKADHPTFAAEVISGKKQARDSLTGILSPDSPNAHEADAILTMLMSLRHRYANPAPQLALGTIVARTVADKPEYLVCMQPVCDSVRLEGSRAFAFLPLTAAGNSKNCELIIRHEGQLKFLTFKPSPYKLEMIAFSPNKNEKVMGGVQDVRFLFTSTNNVLFEWIADLKPAHAQRIANNFANTFSRVGLVESEWNRMGSSL